MAKAKHRTPDAVEPSSTSQVSPLPPWRQRWALIAVAIVSLLVLTSILAGPSFGIVLGRSSDLYFALVWLVAAAGYGTVLPMKRDEHDALRRVTMIAAGLGIMSLVELLLGLAGQLN